MRPLDWWEACSHRWIDPRDAPIARAPYAPVIGPLRRQMKPDTEYYCNNCGEVLKTVAQERNRA